MVDEQKQPDEPETPPASEPVNERLRRGLFWALEYWRELFNFRFDKYMIIQVIPGVYGVALTAIGLGLLYLCFEAFVASTWRGLFFLFIGGLLLALSGYAAYRSTKRASVPLDEAGAYASVAPTLTSVAMEVAQEMVIEAGEDEDETEAAA